MTEHLTDEQIEALVAAATPGPWEIYRYKNGGGRIHISGDDGRERTLIADVEDSSDGIATIYNEGDREFLLAARSLVPALLARARKAEAENARLRKEVLDEWIAIDFADAVAERNAAEIEVDHLAARLASAEAKLAAVEKERDHVAIDAGRLLHRAQVAEAAIAAVRALCDRAISPHQETGEAWTVCALVEHVVAVLPADATLRTDDRDGAS